MVCSTCYSAVDSVLAIFMILRAICSGERTKSIHPLSIALSGISGCPAVSGFCATVIPPTSFMPHNAAAPSPSYPDTITAISLPSQFFVIERIKKVITSGHPQGFDIGFSRNSPFKICKSRFSGMMKTWLG
jgi:hypothetical protein